MSSSKNEGHVRDAGEAYRRHWTVNSAKQDTQEAISQRKDQAEEIGNTYYDLATLNYEYGWGRKFHFAPFQKGESIDAALAREEHFMALNLGLEPGMKVLDIGCGIGEPARSIARFAEVHVTGISTNRGHIARARKLTKEARMEGRVEFLLGDFCVSDSFTGEAQKMPFPDNSFDAVYAIESTCYAADLEDPFSEVRRVLKPGGKFGDYEFIMTEKYEKDNSTHEDVKFRIQRGTGCYTLRTPSDVSKALTTVGLEIVRSKDTCVVSDNNPVPWW
ncbi:hypothetical protein G7Y89_g13793 [Cudoniella acicularis]|uniref:SAM-dependent methyltransferase Erg6/SMT-type domain-containing protein n=1 Tax=Cudoniella acicularis TaxID=354080 RepID=A0A8H4R8L4_9HELO|nr:hypothetical protein G7Y89_g13793 [Cudoniella acicularis]